MWWSAASSLIPMRPRRICWAFRRRLLPNMARSRTKWPRAMADGALRHARAQLAIAVTGIAGPGGGSAEKPVGLVHIALADGQDIASHAYRFGDIGRAEVRLATVREAVKLLHRDQPANLTPWGAKDWRHAPRRRRSSSTRPSRTPCPPPSQQPVGEFKSHAEIHLAVSPSGVKRQ